MGNGGTVRWIVLSIIAVFIASVIGGYLLAPAPTQNAALWRSFNAAVHRPAEPVDGVFVLNGLRPDATPMQVEAWANDWDRSVVQGEVAIKRNPDGSPAVIMRGLRMSATAAGGRPQKIIENLVLICDGAGHPLSIRVSFMLGDGGPPLVRAVDVRTGGVTEANGTLRNLRALAR